MSGMTLGFLILLVLSVIALILRGVLFWIDRKDDK